MEESVGFIVEWGAISLINVGLAKSQGRSGMAWWLASLFIGPLATFLITVLPPITTFSAS